MPARTRKNGAAAAKEAAVTSSSSAAKATPVKKKPDAAAGKTVKKPLKRLGQETEDQESKASTSSAAPTAPKPDHQVAKIRIEHCKSCQVFKRRAQGVVSALSEVDGLCVEDVEVVINEEKPRRGAFEVTVVLEDGTEANVWSGVKKGPPRKLKFPENDQIVDAVRKVL